MMKFNISPEPWFPKHKDEKHHRNLSSNDTSKTLAQEVWDLTGTESMTWEACIDPTANTYLHCFTPLKASSGLSEFSGYGDFGKRKLCMFVCMCLK